MEPARVDAEESASSRGEARGAGTALVVAEEILLAIHDLRGQRVMLDADLAALYGVETKALTRAVVDVQGEAPCRPARRD
jgi:hypothetical protein